MVILNKLVVVVVVEAFGYEVTRPSISPYLVDTVSART